VIITPAPHTAAIAPTLMPVAASAKTWCCSGVSPTRSPMPEAIAPTPFSIRSQRTIRSTHSHIRNVRNGRSSCISSSERLHEMIRTDRVTSVVETMIDYRKGPNSSLW
jgi:hypothetical protein